MGNTLLLIDCNPQNNTGEQLESMLASAGVGDQLRREIVVDPACLSLDQRWFGEPGANKPSLIFLLLLPAHAGPGGTLIESIRKAHPDIPIIVVVDELGPTETLDLLHKGASDLITPPLRITLHSRGARANALSTSPAVPYFQSQPSLKRNACACGGGCPRCQAGVTSRPISAG